MNGKKARYLRRVAAGAGKIAPKKSWLRRWWEKWFSRGHIHYDTDRAYPELKKYYKKGIFQPAGR